MKHELIGLNWSQRVWWQDGKCCPAMRFNHQQWAWGGHMSCMCVEVWTVKKQSYKLSRESLHLRSKAAVKYQQGLKHGEKHRLCLVVCSASAGWARRYYVCILLKTQSNECTAWGRMLRARKTSPKIHLCFSSRLPFKWKGSTNVSDLELILKSHKERFTVE